jgi:hypothetical protein
MESRQTSTVSLLALILSFFLTLKVMKQNRELLELIHPNLKPEPRQTESRPSAPSPAESTEPIKTAFDPGENDDPDISEAFEEYLMGGEFDEQSDAYFKVFGFHRASA